MEEAIPESRKRPLEMNVHDTPYYKMRALLRDLRPHFIEVLKTPDFRNCKAADEIREGMKVMMELYKEMTADSVKLQKCSNVPGFSFGDAPDGQNLSKQKKDEKTPVSFPLDGKDDLNPGTYIVGGSAIGWNFITFHGTTAVYYGQTKEAYRAANPIPS